MNKLNKQVKNIVLGIKYKKTFKIQDVSGQIIDHILNNNKSPFDSDFFPKILETRDRKKILKSKDESELRVTEEEIVIILNTNEDNFEARTELIKNKVIDYYEKSLFTKFGIHNIARIGIMFEINILNNNFINKKIKQIVGNKNVHDINLAFSEKFPTDSGLSQKDVFDYINTNYILKTKTIDNKSILSFQYDYQKIYKPFVTELRDCNIRHLFDLAIGGLEKNYEGFFTDYLSNNNDESKKEK